LSNYIEGFFFKSNHPIILLSKRHLKKYCTLAEYIIPSHLPGTVQWWQCSAEWNLPCSRPIGVWGQSPLSHHSPTTLPMDSLHS
jgi:hypothetical protein